MVVVTCCRKCGYTSRLGIPTLLTRHSIESVDTWHHYDFHMTFHYEYYDNDADGWQGVSLTLETDRIMSNVFTSFPYIIMFPILPPYGGSEGLCMKIGTCTCCYAITTVTLPPFEFLNLPITTHDTKFSTLDFVSALIPKNDTSAEVRLNRGTRFLFTIGAHWLNQVRFSTVLQGLLKTIALAI